MSSSPKIPAPQPEFTSSEQAIEWVVARLEAQGEECIDVDDPDRLRQIGAT